MVDQDPNTLSDIPAYNWERRQI